MLFQSRVAARADFKSLMQGEKAVLREFSRRVWSLGDVETEIWCMSERWHELWAVHRWHIRHKTARPTSTRGVWNFQSGGNTSSVSWSGEKNCQIKKRETATLELQGVFELMSRSKKGYWEMGGSTWAGAELRRIQTSNDQKLDELAPQIKVQNLRLDELATQLQMQNLRHNDLVTQMQRLTVMMEKIVNFVIPALHPQNLPRQETAHQPRQLFDHN